MIQLAQSTGIAQVDVLLAACFTEFDKRFSDRIRSVYLTGSVANGTTDHLSDVDAIVIVAGLPSAEDQRIFKSLTAAWSARSGVLLDLVLQGDEELIARGALTKKVASWVLIYGEETRDRVPPMFIEQYADAIMRGSIVCLKHPRGSPTVLPYPLTYPDPDGEFFGYERNGFREFDGWRSPGTKALVNSVSLAATTLVAVRTGYCATSRRESFAAYRERIGGRWATFLDEIHTRCRDEWSYRVPEDPDDHARLRRLCHSVLDFENEYLLTSIRYLRSQIHVGDGAQATRAAEILGQIRYDPNALPSFD